MEYSQGDLRKAILFLQSAHRLYAHHAISPSAIADIAGSIPNEIVLALLNAWLGKHFETIETQIAWFMKQGYSAVQLLNQLHDALVLNGEISGKEKASMAIQLGRVEKALVDGADEHLQLLALMI